MIAGLRSEMEDRLSELKTMLLDLAHRQSLSEKWRDRQDMVRLYRALLATGLGAAHARDLVEMAGASQEAWGGALLDQLRQTVRPMVRCLGAARPIPRLLSVIGPSGSGKTSTVMRLASHLRQRGRKVALISLDTLKLGAAEQLTQFARIMGLGLKVAQGPEGFQEARELFQPADHVLVDTSTRDLQPGPGGRGIPAALSGAGAMGLLALPAGSKAEDLSAAWKAASGPLLWGVALTKLDETQGLGNVLDFARSVGPLFAYFSHGPRAPEDFFEAEADRLLDLWLAPVAPETEGTK
jgi:flagellar biosynthesis GTPase FlhF